MNKQLLLNGVLLVSMVGTLLQGADEHPVIAATKRLKAATQALANAQEHGATSDKLDALQAQLQKAKTDLDQYDIGLDPDNADDGSDSDSESDNGSDDDSETDSKAGDNNNSESDTGSHAAADDRDENADQSPDGPVNAGNAVTHNASNTPADDQSLPASSWNRTRIGTCIVVAWVYRFVIAPRLAKRVRKMRKGRMRTVLGVLTFAK